jgi:hypothetical protein
MKTGTMYAESLTRATPLEDDALADVVKEYGFAFCCVLMSCTMHVALWTRLDIFMTCVVLAQYQNNPSHFHFAAIKQMVGYLRLHQFLWFMITVALSTMLVHLISKSIILIHSKLISPDRNLTMLPVFNSCTPDIRPIAILLHRCRHQILMRRFCTFHQI